MSYPPARLSDEHVRALREAVLLVSQAKSAAADVLARSGIEPGALVHGSLEYCTGVEPSGRRNQPCGCPGFRGDSDFCFSQYRDFTGPDIGAGAIIRVCGHPQEYHESF
ncbi:DUF6422 family protein [Streptomyces sp. NPDC093093]|uniref:DUF6422 family protein n=1 Tax=Streptomyces sp. NPDC093093 TaxID=3366025 RepID=UPI0038171DFB